MISEFPWSSKSIISFKLHILQMKEKAQWEELICIGSKILDSSRVHDTTHLSHVFFRYMGSGISALRITIVNFQLWQRGITYYSICRDPRVFFFHWLPYFGACLSSLTTLPEGDKDKKRNWDLDQLSHWFLHSNIIIIMVCEVSNCNEFEGIICGFCSLNQRVMEGKLQNIWSTLLILQMR